MQHGVIELASLAGHLADRLGATARLELQPGRGGEGAPLVEAGPPAEATPGSRPPPGSVIHVDASTWDAATLESALRERQDELRRAALVVMAHGASTAARPAGPGPGAFASRIGLDPILDGWIDLPAGRRRLWIGQGRRWLERPDPGPRVVALLAVYNEIEILAETLAHLEAEGVEVHLIDNWSTDGTYELARERRDGQVAGLERFPAGGRGPFFQIGEIARRKEELARSLDADWFLNTDADEIRQSPFPGVGLREAVAWVDASGFNAVDFTLLDFVADVDAHDPARPYADQVTRWRPGYRPGHFLQKKLWKSTAGTVDLHSTAGHEARFPGRRVFPFNFLLRHYPVRSAEQARRKYDTDRIPSPGDRERRWGEHYDVDPLAGRDVATTAPYRDDFRTEHLADLLEAFGHLLV